MSLYFSNSVFFMIGLSIGLVFSLVINRRLKYKYSSELDRAYKIRDNYIKRNKELDFRESRIAERIRSIDAREQKIKIREKEYSASADLVILRRIAKGHRQSFSRVLSYPVFSYFNRYNPFTMSDFYLALTTPMEFVSPLQVHARIKLKEDPLSTYEVSLDSCSCATFQKKHLPCKHMFRLAVELGLLLQFDDVAERQSLKSIKEKTDELNTIQQSFDAQRAAIKELESGVNRILHDKLGQYSWAAYQYADLMFAKDTKSVDYLLYKERPAYTAAEKVSAYASQLKITRQKLKTYEYKLRIYESIVPWLTDMDDISPVELMELSDNIKSSSENEYDELRTWLSPQEYQSLSSAEKYQLALDRWKTRKKTNWEAGRDFERFVGYQYEQRGYNVRYIGALMGVNDLGRDLIAIKDAASIIIQCKRWNEQRTIHEKHVFQLYGSVVGYAIENPLSNVRGLLVTTCPISGIAQKYAEYLDIQIDSSYSSRNVFDYPMIKCNIGNTGERIYHLPFDQQYDRVVISPEKGEFYALTVAEAESKGFRRAFRWHSS